MLTPPAARRTCLLGLLTMWTFIQTGGGKDSGVIQVEAMQGKASEGYVRHEWINMCGLV